MIIIIYFVCNNCARRQSLRTRLWYIVKQGLEICIVIVDFVVIGSSAVKGRSSHQALSALVSTIV